MCNATLQKDKAFLNIILFSEKPHQGNDPARYVSVLNKIYHILSKDKHFCAASKEWLFPCKPHHFKKELGKTVTSPSMALLPCANPCLVADSVPCALSEHNEICVFIIKAQKQEVIHSWLSLSDHSGIGSAALMLSCSSAQSLTPYLVLRFCALRATLLLL